MTSLLSQTKSPTSLRARWIRLAAVSVVAAMALSLASCGNKESVTLPPAKKTVKVAPLLKDPSATGRELITKWMTALKDGDTAAIEALLAPNFQIRRADGSTANKAQYVKTPAVVSGFELSDQLVGLQSGQTLSVTWGMKAVETIGGVDYSAAEALRITGFEWNANKWQIVTYANFNAPSTDTMKTSISPSSTTTAK